MTKTGYLSRNEVTPFYFINIYIDFASQRLRIDDYRGNIASIIERIHEIANKYELSKIIIKAKDSDWRMFLSNGYQLEGILDGYYSGSTAYFVCYYTNDQRRTSDHWKEEDTVLQSVLQLSTGRKSELPSGYTIRFATTKDAPRLANLYHEVFPSYPTPMNETNYIKKVIQEGTIFCIVEWNETIVSAASAEVNAHHHNAEITDCATLQEHRKFGFMKLLIERLENKLLEQNIYCVYSLARALSFGMNSVFYKMNYEYNGRLTKNCEIFSKLEDMNLWVKKLV